MLLVSGLLFVVDYYYVTFYYLPPFRYLSLSVVQEKKIPVLAEGGRTTFPRVEVCSLVPLGLRCLWVLWDDGRTSQQYSLLVSHQSLPKAPITLLVGAGTHISSINIVTTALSWQHWPYFCWTSGYIIPGLWKLKSGRFSFPLLHDFILLF